MEQVIMPELITQEFAEVIAENPEVLRILVEQRSNEKVIVGQDCTLNCGCNPTNVKLVFCNVTICLEDPESECGKGCGEGGTEEQLGGCHIKINGSDLKQKGMEWVGLSGELYQLKLEITALEAKMNEAEKLLKMIPRQPCNRKLIARCKFDVNEALEQLTAKKMEFEHKAWFGHIKI